MLRINGQKTVNHGITLILFESSLVSTHVVCERLSAMHYHIPVNRIFGSKFLECPHSSISEMWSGVNLPPPSPQWKFGFSGVPTIPPPSKDLSGSWCMKTNRCVPQGYHLVVMVLDCARQL